MTSMTLSLDLTTQPGRLLYYSVDNALDALNTAPHPQHLQNVAVVTFTEGIGPGFADDDRQV